MELCCSHKQKQKFARRDYERNASGTGPNSKQTYSHRCPDCSRLFGMLTSVLDGQVNPRHTTINWQPANLSITRAFDSVFLPVYGI
jgi:hypothetical protein